MILVCDFLFMQFNSSEDRIALAGLGFAAIVVIWASSNLITVNFYNFIAFLLSGLLYSKFRI